MLMLGMVDMVRSSKFRLPLGRQEAKAHYVVVALPVKVLFAQDAFLMEALALMKLDGVLVVGQGLAADLVQPENAECMLERASSQLTAGAGGGSGAGLKSPNRLRRRTRSGAE